MVLGEGMIGRFLGKTLSAAFATALLAHGACFAGTPKPAPAAYATPNYGLTFQVPPGLTYCPLPDNWVGSDHGTTLFLTPPKQCRSAGYAASERAFEPVRTPRIEIYYGWWSEDGPAHACRRPRGAVRVFDHLQPLCRVRRDGLVGVELHATYPLSGEAEAMFTLLTTREALSHELAAFERLAESARTCTPIGAGKGFGRGPPCPKGVRWF